MLLPLCFSLLPLLLLLFLEDFLPFLEGLLDLRVGGGLSENPRVAFELLDGEAVFAVVVEHFVHEVDEFVGQNRVC